jgi:hypothetical protein
MNSTATAPQKVSSKDWKEGEVTKKIEKQTAKIPSDVFLYGALGAVAIALTLKVMGRDHRSLFVGQWVAPMLLFGLYNKIVKTQGHDQQDKGDGYQRS